jgi:xanthine dehydrogenase accessory factor
VRTYPLRRGFSMLAIWRAAVEEVEKGRDFVLAAILNVEGSSPRHVGTRFLVRKDGEIVGTIGGGLFEAKVQKLALDVLESGSSRRVGFAFTGPDADSTDMICGGQTDVLVEFIRGNDQEVGNILKRLLEMNLNRESGYFFSHIPIASDGTGDVNHLLVDQAGTRIGGFPGDAAAMQGLPASRLLKPAQLIEPPGSEVCVFLESIRTTGTVFIFGAGHVGECVSHLAAYVNFNVVVIDDRSDWANAQRVPDADKIIVLDSFEQPLANLGVDHDSYVVIVTRGHAHDKWVLAQTLKTDAGYIGMIGSRRKNKLIFESLLVEGFTREDLARVHAPIGLPIGGETPQEIGVSIVGEMIQTRNKKDRLQELGS